MVHHRVKVALDKDRTYEIRIGSALHQELPAAALAAAPAPDLFIVAGRKIASLALDSWLKPLRRAAIPFRTEILPDGERHKNLKTYQRLMNSIAAGGGLRDTVVVAFGGGVIGDLAGFAAATYRRGVPFIQVPTTLLALVDSSVGGKTGVDLHAGKNLAGAFHQPSAVIADIDFLKTLPRREFRAGYAEIIKYGTALDADFFAFLESNLDSLFSGDPEALAKAIKRCCELKAKIVSKDERDKIGARTLLNFGHTFGHAFEAAGGYSRLRHGEAVAVGMLCAADLSVALKALPASAAARLESLIRRAGLPVSLSGFDLAEIEKKMVLDKKFRAGHTRLVLLKGIGKAFLKEGLTAKELRPALKKRLHP